MFLLAYRVKIFLVLALCFGVSGGFALAQQPKATPAPTRSDGNAQSQGTSSANKPCPNGAAASWNNCTGTTELPNGDRYVGNFRNGLPDGIGTYYWQNGRQYSGEIKNARASGKGKFTTLANIIYEGDFIDGKIVGKGSVYYPNGARYVGELKDFRRVGQGIYTVKNGDKFTGEFVNDEMAPIGVLALSNGDSFSGEIQAMKPNGKGTYTFKDGRKLIGLFATGAPRGAGTLFASDGSQLASGDFAGWDSLTGSQTAKSAEQAAAPQQSAQVPDPNDVFIVPPQGSSETQQSSEPAPAADTISQNSQVANPQPAPANEAISPPSPIAPATTSSASVGNGPVICRFKNGFWYDSVQCDVIGDRVAIREIVFNRGQCPSATEGLKALTDMKQKDGGNITLLFRAIFLNVKDFRKPKTFGERIEIPVVSCTNLLEYTVEANNTVQTWKTY